MVRLIAAIDSKRGLANDAGIPWQGKVPSDSKFFRDQTKDGLILMGAGTNPDFPTPLHDRLNYVATHSSLPLRPGFEAVHDIEAFFREHAGEVIQDIGGAGFFAQTIQYADELVLTLLEDDFGCTKFFPAYTADFELVSQSEPLTENGITFRFTTWHRKPTAD